LCPVCGAALTADGGGGWCPRCALAGAFDARVDDTVLFTVPGHAVLAELGRGAAGIVYRARQEQPAREVALKILRPHEMGSAESLARFRLEAATVAALDHLAILPVLSVGEHDGLPYFTMKLCRGSLAERLESYRGKWRGTAELVALLAGAVQHAHARGVLHRDLKPGNVLFDEADRPFISDFGLAKLVEAAGTTGPVTRPLLVMGTPGYIAPEVLAGGAGAATTAADVFSLGALLHELLTGALPPAAGAALAPRPGAPRDLAVICAHALAAEPARRYVSAAALAEDLHAWLAGRSIAARPASALERGWAWARRNPALAVLTMALGLTLTGATVVLALKNHALDTALAEAQAASRRAELNLADALVAQARTWRESGRMGQRFGALELLTRAARINPGFAVWNEAAAALARPDLKRDVTLPAYPQKSEFDELDFSPDLGLWASGTKEGGLAMRRTDNGSVEQVLPAQSPGLPWFVRFAADNRHVLAIFYDERLHVWDRPTGRLLFTAMGSESQPIRAALHPTEGRLAWVDGAGVLRIRELATAAERVLGTVPPGVRRLAFSPEGGRLALVVDGSLEVWDIADAQRLWRWPGDLARTEPAWSADGAHVAVSQLRPVSEIIILHAGSGELRQRLPAMSTSVARMAFVPGGPLLASMETIGELTLWDWEQKEKLVQAPTGRSALRVTPDGRRLGLAVSFQELGIMSLAEDKVLRPWRRGKYSSYVTHALAFAPDGTAGATIDREGIRLWDVAAGREQAAAPFKMVLPSGADMSLAFEPQGRSQLMALNDGVVHRLKGLEAGDPAFQPVTPGGGHQLGRLVGSDLFVNSSVARRVEIWPGGDPTKARRATGTAEDGVEWGTPIVCVNGLLVATPPTGPGQVEVWDARTAKQVARLPADRRVGGDFSPDGRWLVLGSDQGYTVYDTKDWQPKPLRAVQLRDEFRGWARFSPDGRWLALLVGSRTIELRNARNLEPVVQLDLTRGPGREEQEWSPDGSRFCVVSHGNLIYEWNLPALERELAALGLGAASDQQSGP